MEEITAAHKKNFLIWTSVLVGMLILVTVVYFLHSSAVFEPVADSRSYGQIFFIVAIIFASAILILKRSILLPEKVVTRLSKENVPEKPVGLLLSRIRFNFLIIWTLAEAILLTGFINYILTADFNNFMILAVVALYSLVINIPRENTLHRAVALLEELG